MPPVIDLSQWLPAASDGSRTLLPKQKTFKDTCLDRAKSAPKFIAYVGGIGSGKSVIGCATIRDMAILEAGDYLVGRQFLPELKSTTYKTFLELCPPELILEHRVAEMTIRLRAVNGVSNVYFRGLEEPDKLRSMNLCAFLVDEANQVSEDAFTLLQGRLRGRAWRKGLIVSNPNGHDWLYRWFVKQDHLKNDWSKAQYYLVRAPSTENIHLPDGYLSSLIEAWSEDRIKREIEGSFDAFSGQVYSEFRRDVHVIKPFRLPDWYPRFIGMDHGYRNPAAIIWVAVGPDGELYVYREFYQSGWLIEEIVKGKLVAGTKKIYDQGLLGLTMKEKITAAVIDPSTCNRRGTNGESDYDEYLRHIPAGFPLGMANNAKELGIDRVKSYLKVNPRTGKPNMYIFEDCYNVIEEMTQYRYQELRPGQEGKKAEKEEPYKIHDHALDALRYVSMLLPEPSVPGADPKEGMTYTRTKVYDEFQALKGKIKKDPLSIL